MKCRKCEIEKLQEDFPKGRRVCKKCASINSMEWAKKNRDKTRANAKKFRENNRELCRERCLNHYYNNSWKYREWRINNNDKCREYTKKYRELNHEKVKESRRNSEKIARVTKKQEHAARKDVYYAIKRGKLIKPECCSICGGISKIEAHHMDYEKTLEVTWVCRLCHSGIHMMLKQYNKKINNGSK